STSNSNKSPIQPQPTKSTHLQESSFDRCLQILGHRKPEKPFSMTKVSRRFRAWRRRITGRSEDLPPYTKNGTGEEAAIDDTIDNTREATIDDMRKLREKLIKSQSEAARARFALDAIEAIMKPHRIPHLSREAGIVAEAARRSKYQF
ncbi:hypothetical protein BGZ63DRAFT_444514, partial [Mariannaea sp. PMI_226]